MSTIQGRAKDRGKDFERKLVTELNLSNLPARRVGQFGGKTDVLVDRMVAIQAKYFASARFPGWMAQELRALLDEMPELEPALVIGEASGRGTTSRRLVVIDWHSFIDYLYLMNQKISTKE